MTAVNVKLHLNVAQEVNETPPSRGTLSLLNDPIVEVRTIAEIARMHQRIASESET